jgi:hypothetical protein
MGLFRPEFSSITIGRRFGSDDRNWMCNTEAIGDQPSNAKSRRSGMLWYAAAALGGVVLIGIYSDRPQGAIPAAIFGFFWILLDGYRGQLYRHAARHLQESGREVLKNDTRPAILFLRAFCDDQAKLEGYEGKYTIPGSPIQMTFEEYLCARFNELGPLVAIAKPGEHLPPLGAARFRVVKGDWTEVINKIAISAQYILLVMGPLPKTSQAKAGLAWEVERVFQADLRDKLILMVPPISDVEISKRWDLYRGLSNNQLPIFRGGEIAAVANGPQSFDASRVFQVLRKRERWMYFSCLRIDRGECYYGDNRYR